MDSTEMKHVCPRVIVGMELLDKLTNEDKAVIQKTWTVLKKHINDTAYRIFEMIFNQSPDTKQLFPFMKIQNGGSHSREMEFHGLRFMQVLESVVKSIDNPAALDPLCDNLGRVHGRLIESRGFKAYHWGVFIECTLFHFRRVLSNDSNFSSMIVLDRAIILWRNILRVLIKRMKVGLETDLRNRQVNSNESRRTRENRTHSDSSSSPVGANDELRHSMTLPAISEMTLARDHKRNESGLFRPLRDFARRRFMRDEDSTNRGK